MQRSDIAGYEGRYQVSKDGRIWSVRTRKERVLYQNSGGYMQVNLYRPGEAKTYLVHRLVAQAFHANPDNKPEVNHINGLRADNSAENLEWNTRSENQQHAFHVLGKKATSYWAGKNGGQHHASKYIVASKSDGTGLVFPGVNSAARYLGVSAGHISRAATGKRDGFAGFDWHYVPFPSRGE